MRDKIFIEALEVRCKIGIFAWERKILQKITIDLEIPTDARKAALKDRIADATDYKAIAKHILKFARESEYYLLETLAEEMAASLLKKFKIPSVTLRISKPGAIRFSKNVGIEIMRRK